MSRTFAHVPADVELARVNDKSILRTSHRHWVAGRGIVSCPDPDARCAEYMPNWASAQPWARRGTARFERRTAIDVQMRQAVKEYRTHGEVDADVYIDPDTYCMCQMCGVR